MSPTGRTLTALRRAGWIAWPVEKWVAQRGIRIDCFHFADKMSVKHRKQKNSSGKCLCPWCGHAFSYLESEPLDKKHDMGCPSCKKPTVWSFSLTGKYFEWVKP